LSAAVDYREGNSPPVRWLRALASLRFDTIIVLTRARGYG
jgi:hypothetical protein